MAGRGRNRTTLPSFQATRPRSRDQPRSSLLPRLNLEVLLAELAAQNGHHLGEPLGQPYVNLPLHDESRLSQDLIGLANRPNLVRAWGDRLARAALTDMAGALRFDARGYTRTPIARTQDAEVLLMCWLPGQKTLVHDHGQISARVFIVAGRAVETEFVHGAAGLRPVEERPLDPGQEFRERPGSIHRVECVGHDALVTLHLNAPPLVSMQNFSHVADAARDR